MHIPTGHSEDTFYIHESASSTPAPDAHTLRKVLRWDIQRTPSTTTPHPRVDSRRMKWGKLWVWKTCTVLLWIWTTTPTPVRPISRHSPRPGMSYSCLPEPLELTNQNAISPGVGQDSDKLLPWLRNRRWYLYGLNKQDMTCLLVNFVGAVRPICDL